MNHTDDMIEQAIDQAKSDEVLSDIDVGYIQECLEGQLEDLLSDSTKKNYLKKLEEKLNASDIDESDKALVLNGTYNHVIDMITEKFNFTIDRTENRLDLIAKTLYKFFVLQYTHNVTCFIESFILENQKTIVTELSERDDLNTRHIEGVSSKLSLVLNNISDVIDIIEGSSISFDEFVDYIIKHEDAKSSVSQIQNFTDSIMSDTEEIVGLILNGLINEDEGFSSIYTELQLNLYNRFANDN